MSVLQKKVVCACILMHSTNQRCNTLQVMAGLFLHSCHAPETAVDFLSQVGVSVSRSTIDYAVTNLSKQAVSAIRKLGRTLLMSPAYDNFDVELKQSVPAVDQPHDNLLHLTSGTFIRLEHGAARSDLKCSKELWEKSENNPDNATKSSGVDWTKLLTIHPDPVTSRDDLNRHECFALWKFLNDLISHGPAYFSRFAKNLGDPEVVEQIPVVKSKQVPAAAMDINQSTVQGNADAITNLCKQAGIGDRTVDEGAEDIGDHVILVHGDLLTCERVQSLQASRGVEKTPWLRFAFVIFVMGLFHLKMACADAIWKIFIQPKQARGDNTSLFQLVAEIRPKETGKIGSKPGFRRMHEVIRHVGTASCLDCWREAVSKLSEPFSSLESWAATEPCWEEVENIARKLVKTYLPNMSYSQLRFRPPETRDKVQENVLLQDQYFMYYEELSHAMDAGDIGRVETCFMPWVFIFKGCGKHKYATQMIRFLYNLYFVYPPNLR